MTNEKAIEELEFIKEHISPTCAEAIDTGIKAINLSIPKPVNMIDKNALIYQCPTCGTHIYFMQHKRCIECGQTFDFGYSCRSCLECKHHYYHDFDLECYKHIRINDSTPCEDFEE